MNVLPFRKKYLTKNISTGLITIQLIKINNLVTIFPGSDATKNMLPEELNEILLRMVPNGWAKQSHLQVWDFQMKMFIETCTMFEIMEIAEQVYEGKTPSGKYPGQMPTVTVVSGIEGGGGPTFPTNLDKVCASK